MAQKSKGVKKPDKSVPTRHATPMDHYDVLFGESDRGCVLVGAAMIDERLADLLRAAFVDGMAEKLIDGGNAPIGAFATRCHVARAFGLLSAKDHSDLDLIRKIRNDAAHFEKKRGFDTGFDNETTRDRCLTLSIAKVVAAEYTVTIQQLHPKAVFCLAVPTLLSILSSRTHKILEELTQIPRWDALSIMMKFVEHEPEMAAKALRITGTIDPTKPPTAE